MGVEDFESVIKKAHASNLRGVTLRVLLTLLCCRDEGTNFVLMTHQNIADRADVNREQVTVAVRALKKNGILTTAREKGCTRFTFM